jgi:hypothetical protein
MMTPAMRPQARLRFLTELARVDLEQLAGQTRMREPFLARLRAYLSETADVERMQPEVAAAMLGDLSKLRPAVKLVRKLVEAVLSGQVVKEREEGPSTIQLRPAGRGLIVAEVEPHSLRDMVLRRAVEDLRSGGQWIYARPVVTSRIVRCPACRRPFFRAHGRTRYCTPRCRRIAFDRRSAKEA